MRTAVLLQGGLTFTTGPAPQPVLDGEERTNGVTKRYLVGLGLDEVWAVRTGSTDEYLLHDVYTNSVIAAVDRASVTVRTGYGYSPFGVVTKSNSPTPSANTMQYGGHENDNTGLYYYRARYYSPVLQRFISEDPIGFGGGDTNLYRYVGNNPHVGSDATGLCGIECNSSAFNESVDSVFFEGGAVSDRSPYRGYRPEGFTVPSGGRDGTLVAVAPALPVAAGVGVGVAALGAAVRVVDWLWGMRGGLTSITGPGPQPPLGPSFNKADNTEKSIRSLEKRLAEHEKKLEDYLQNPEAADNQGLLRDAPSSEIRQKIVQGRRKKLEREIEGFRKQLDRLRRQ